MAKRLMDLAPWLGALGVLIMLVGLGWDGLLHAQDPALAARDGVFTLTNPGRALFAVGLALCVLTAVYYLVGLAQSRFLRVPGLRALCWAAAIVLVVAAIGSLTLTLGRGNDTSGYARTAATTDLTALPNPHAQHSALTSAQASTPTPVAGCDFAPIDLNKYGKVPFQSADVKSAVNGIVEATLWVTYTNATSTTIGGCPVQLRSYNGNLIGPTLRVKPGDTISITLHNDLPDNLPVEDPDHGAALDYNTTNVHTHGLHVSPTGNSDNV
ncbi:MAG TPA: multicopper oxidase domain-containing protein, partial [Chloroflexia bacterium]